MDQLDAASVFVRNVIKHRLNVCLLGLYRPHVDTRSEAYLASLEAAAAILIENGVVVPLPNDDREPGEGGLGS